MKLTLFYITILVSFFSFCQENEKLEFDSNISYSQEYIDSLLIIPKFSYSVTDLKKILETNKLFGWTYYYNKLTSIAIQEQKLDSAIYYSNRAIKAYTNSKVKRDFDEQFLVRTYNLKGLALQRKKDYNNAVINYQRALVLSKKYPYKWTSFIVSGIARSNYQLGNDSLALKYFLQVSKDTLYMGLPRPAITTYTSIGGIYVYFGEINKAKYFYKKGLETSNRTNYKVNIATLFGSLGIISKNEKEIDSAVYYFEKALKADLKYGIGGFHGAKDNNEFYKSYVNVYKGPLNKAINDLNILVNKINSYEKLTIIDRDLMLNTLELLGVAYQKKENYKEYQNILTVTFNFFNTFQKGQLKENLQGLETQYQTKEKDESIEQLEESKAQQETIIKQQKSIAYGIGGLFILLSGLAYLFWRQRKLKTQYEKENLEQRLLRSQMNPHFIGNAMNTVSALVEKKSEDTISYINSLSNLFRLILTNSREEFVSLEDEVITIKTYLELQSNFSTAFNFSFTVDEDIDQELIIIPPMLIQPLVENAIVHGLTLTNNEKRGQINIEIIKQNDKGLLLCKITDNGIGYIEEKQINTSRNHKSVSGDIIKERLKILKKKFKVNTRVLFKNIDEGTSIEIYLPFLIDD